MQQEESHTERSLHWDLESLSTGQSELVNKVPCGGSVIDSGLSSSFLTTSHMKTGWESSSLTLVPLVNDTHSGFD